MIRDFRYALRTLLKSPGFTAATVLTLALGIGANSAMFSVIDAVLLKPLPYAHPDQLTLVYTTTAGGRQNFVSQPDLDDWRASAKSFRGFASLVPQSVNLTGGAEPDRIVGSFVSANYFEVFEVQAARGRTFAAGEDRPGTNLTAVLTDRLWHAKFGGDPNILGRAVQLNGDSYTVIGVLPAAYIDQPWDVDVFLPAYKYPNYAIDRSQPIGAVVGRIAPGASIAQAQAEMTAIAARLAAAYPKTNRDRGAQVVPLKQVVVGNLAPTIAALAGAVGFVLLIACANVAGLFTARMVGRERERSIRQALGASRSQLMAQVIAEALVLAGASGAAAMAIAAWGIEALAKPLANQLPNGTTLSLDPAVIAFTGAIAMICALLIAAIPAWQASAAQVLREGRSAGAGASRNRSRSVLAAAQIAIAMVLLTGAGLTIKSLLELGRAQVGFDTRNLMTFEYRLPRTKYPTGAAQNEFHQRVIEEIGSVPGVIAATSVRAAPLGGNGQSGDFFLADRPEPAPADRPQGLFNAVDAYFFSTLRIPVLRGRAFEERDSANAAKVIVINQTLAKKFYGDRDPIGRTIRIPQANNLTAQIVGVVGDVKQFSPQDDPSPQIYGALPQNPFVFTSVAVRTAVDPKTVMEDVRRAVWRVDKDQPMWRMQTADARLAALAQPHEFVSSLLGGYAGLALLLASIGIFGVISYSVSQRTAEIGVRMALGATPARVAAVILKQGAVVTGIGILAGMAAAGWLARYLKSELYGVSAMDAGVYALVAGTLAAVAMAACWIPARRAMRVDPVVALRAE